MLCTQKTFTSLTNNFILHPHGYKIKLFVNDVLLIVNDKLLIVHTMSTISFMYKKNKTDPSTEPCKTLLITLDHSE